MIRAHRSAQAMAFSFTALALAVASAHAASVGPSGSAFYDPPAPLPAGAHGDLISYRPATVQLGSGAPEVKAFNVMYLSQDARNGMLPATGTVLVPAAAVPGGGARPVILYAVGTHGLGNNCSASKQLASGKDYEIANINSALKAGYAVLVTDYAGYTNGGMPSYMAGPSQGKNVLDIFKAAQGIPGIGITAGAKVAIWGYSQGGQAAAWAAELQPSYTSGMNLVAVAHGGTPGDFFKTARYLNGRNGAAFLFSAILGLTKEYPTQIPFDLIIDPSKRTELDQIKGKCVFQAVFDYQNQKVEDYSIPGLTFEEMLDLAPVKAVLEAQALGNNPVRVPMYQYHGQADEFIPLDQAVELKQRYCARGTNLTFDLYPSEHIFTQFQSGPTVMTWLNDRFAGKAAHNSCGNNTVPTSTANDNAGNLVISLKKWPMKLAIHINLLKQDITLPPGSVFSGDADMTDKLLKNTVVSVPDFVTPLKFVGLPLNAGVKVIDTGATTATVDISPDGTLHVHGKAQVDVVVNSLNGVKLGGECKTIRPLVVPFDFDGPISTFGNGSINFSGRTALAPFKGCGISAILSTVVSNWQYAYDFNLAPTDPVRY